jgi:hypothetical protein
MTTAGLQMHSGLVSLASESLIESISTWLGGIGWPPTSMNAGQWVSLGFIGLGGGVMVWAFLRAARRERQAVSRWTLRAHADDLELGIDRSPTRELMREARGQDSDWGPITPSAMQKRDSRMPARPASPNEDHAEADSAPLGVARDVHRLTRELMEQLEGKIQTLQVLIAKADDRIRTLEWQGWPEADANAQATQGTEPSRTPRRDVRAVMKHEATDATTRLIYQLADEGQPIIEISRKTGQATGKIELILALRGR